MPARSCAVVLSSFCRLPVSTTRCLTWLWQKPVVFLVASSSEQVGGSGFTLCSSPENTCRLPCAVSPFKAAAGPGGVGSSRDSGGVR